MKYDVHIYAVVRVKHEGIEADSQLEAIELAEDFFSEDDLLRRGEYAEEIVSYLVDEEGDEEYENSKVYDTNYKPVPPTTEQEFRDFVGTIARLESNVEKGEIFASMKQQPCADLIPDETLKTLASVAADSLPHTTLRQLIGKAKTLTGDTP